MKSLIHKTCLGIILLGILASCNNAPENSNAIPQDFLDGLQSKTNDSLSKNKSHIDSPVFVDSVMQILNEAIDPPQ